MNTTRRAETMKKMWFVAVVFGVTLVAHPFRAADAQASHEGTALPSLAEPGISPDGSTIAFVSGGDIWEVPRTGGDARLLVSHGATESRPLYSPDGKQLAFTSTRTGNGDVYVLTLRTGDVERLTYDDAMDQVSGWSPDGKFVYFSSSSHDMSSMLDVYRVSVDGGMPVAVTADRYTTEYFGIPAPVGDAVAITARANASASTAVEHHTFTDQIRELALSPDGKKIAFVVHGEIFSTSAKDGGDAIRLTNTAGEEAELAWSPDSRKLAYRSDRGGTNHLFVYEFATEHETQLTSGNVRDDQPRYS